MQLSASSCPSQLATQPSPDPHPALGSHLRRYASILFRISRSVKIDDIRAILTLTFLPPPQLSLDAHHLLLRHIDDEGGGREGAIRYRSQMTAFSPLRHAFPAGARPRRGSSSVAVMAGGDGILQTVVGASSAPAFHVPGAILLLAPRAEEEEDAMGGRFGWNPPDDAHSVRALDTLRTTLFLHRDAEEQDETRPRGREMGGTRAEEVELEWERAHGEAGEGSDDGWSCESKRGDGTAHVPLLSSRYFRLRALFVGSALVETRSWRAGAGGGTWAGSRVTASLPPLNTRPSIHGSSDTNFAGPPRLGRVEGGRAGEDDEGRDEAADDVRLRGAGCSMSGEDTWRAGPAPPTPVLEELGTPLLSLRRPMRTSGSGAGIPPVPSRLRRGGMDLRKSMKKWVEDGFRMSGDDGYT
ncbi:hypothetical protein DFH09DRAFT_1330744 [Mycena vulgaris]|nr:hypothetical protein DFH09DRAFT_1330744 [Mycena vulgaris]